VSLWEGCLLGTAATLLVVGLHAYWFLEALAFVAWRRRHEDALHAADHAVNEKLVDYPPVVYELQLESINTASAFALDCLRRIPRPLRPYYLRRAARRFDNP
jgi:hypothetical protein